MTCDCNALGVDFRRGFQERQASHHIVEMIGGHEHELQVLASCFSFGRLFALQNVLDERALIG
jgi:hypothetical protein